MSRKLKIAIVGSAPSSASLAPFDDPEWEIWGINGMFSSLPKWDRWFELHTLDDAKRWKKRGKAMVEWAKQQNKPIYMQRSYAENIEVFPFDELVNEYGRYFTNTISWLIAFALSLRADELAIYGVDMAQTTEYQKQRASCEYFIGLWNGYARENRLPECYIPKQAELLKTSHMYAIEQCEFLDKMTARRKELSAQHEKIKQELAQAEANNHYMNGVMENMTYIEGNWRVQDAATTEITMQPSGVSSTCGQGSTILPSAYTQTVTGYEGKQQSEGVHLQVAEGPQDILEE